MKKILVKITALMLICAMLMPYEGISGTNAEANAKGLVCLAAQEAGENTDNAAGGSENDNATSSTSGSEKDPISESASGSENDNATESASGSENDNTTESASGSENDNATESTSGSENDNASESASTSETDNPSETGAINENPQESSESEETSAPSSEEDTKKNILTPSVSFSMQMYKGEKTRLEVANAGGASKVSFSSSSKKIVSVTADGNIKALRCGVAKITVKMSKGSQKMTAVVSVKVTYSSGLSNTYREKSWKQVSSNKKMPVFVMSKELKKGNTTKWKLTGIEKDASVTYASSNKKVCTVSSKGTIKAVGIGTALISVTIRQNDMTYVCKMRIHTAKSVTKSLKISQKTVNKYLSKSGFIGSSIGEGQKMYFNSKGKGFLGNPVMMVKGCYSFANDKSQSTKYKITYKGTPYRAWRAIQVSGVKRVFINMGMNDFYAGADYVKERFVEYLEEIREKNPDVVIFIESMTPVRRNRTYLNNKNIDKLNKMMKAYAKSKKNMYFIDVSTSLKDSSNMLKSAYCSDNYCHLTFAGYESWTNDLVAYMKKFLAKEQTAKDAVKTAEESKLKADKTMATKLVKALEDSTVKTQLLKKLKKI